MPRFRQLLPQKTCDIVAQPAVGCCHTWHMKSMKQKHTNHQKSQHNTEAFHWNFQLDLPARPWCLRGVGAKEQLHLARRLESPLGSCGSWTPGRCRVVEYWFKRTSLLGLLGQSPCLKYDSYQPFKLISEQNFALNIFEHQVLQCLTHKFFSVSACMMCPTMARKGLWHRTWSKHETWRRGEN